MLVGEWVLFNVLPKSKTNLLTLLSKSNRKYLTKHKNSMAQATKTDRIDCFLPMGIAELNIQVCFWHSSSLSVFIK